MIHLVVVKIYLHEDYNALNCYDFASKEDAESFIKKVESETVKCYYKGYEVE